MSKKELCRRLLFVVVVVVDDVFFGGLYDYDRSWHITDLNDSVIPHCIHRGYVTICTFSLRWLLPGRHWDARKRNVTAVTVTSILSL